MKNLTALLNHIGIWISGLTLIAMMGLTAVDVLGRYLFNHPVSGTADLTEVMMIVIVFLALSDTASSGGHISVEVVTSRLPVGKQLLLKTAMLFLSVLVAAVLAWQLGANALYTWRHPENSVVLDIPKAPFLYGSAAGCGTLALALLGAAADCLGKWFSRRKTDKFAGAPHLPG